VRGGQGRPLDWVTLRQPLARVAAGYRKLRSVGSGETWAPLLYAVAYDCKGVRLVTGTPGTQGVYPHPCARDRPVMRLPDLVRILGFVRHGGRARGTRTIPISFPAPHQASPPFAVRCNRQHQHFARRGQLPTAPAPLPKFEVREINGVIEVFAPTKPA
jgi:hypothetical protein